MASRPRVRQEEVRQQTVVHPLGDTRQVSKLVGYDVRDGDQLVVARVAQLGNLQLARPPLRLDLNSVRLPLRLDRQLVRLPLRLDLLPLRLPRLRVPRQPRARRDCIRSARDYVTRARITATESSGQDYRKCA